MFTVFVFVFTKIIAVFACVYRDSVFTGIIAHDFGQLVVVCVAVVPVFMLCLQLLHSVWGVFTNAIDLCLFCVYNFHTVFTM